ncbi:MAG: nickel pincer cofactor biosynthesis protein LarB [Spirochaetales bacterium]|nr:nickel pincer cofactor biosynthesis protein LarB [Spirochaetales bacterium]
MKKIEEILEKVKSGELDIEQASENVEALFFKDLGHTVIDMDRERRTRQAEVIYCAGKTVEQIKDILSAHELEQNGVLCTRMSNEIYEQIKEHFPAGEYDSVSRLFMLQKKQRFLNRGYIAVVSAGTSDKPVAEEAAQTIEFYGHEARRFNDVGVAGLHRLLRHIDEIRGANVIITVAGMEGALTSVVGGLVGVPVIAVPTSVGYGASFHGFTALLSMLNSCASGVSVVNIDNGFGAGYLSVMINN